MRSILLTCLVLAIVSVAWTAVAADQPAPPPPPQPTDRCAVCGMFVAKYPAWTATLVLADGGRLYFDGPKDMFKYLHDLERHGRRSDEIAELWVTDYYSTRQVPARDAHYITGSDVLGPMGAELVAVAGAEAAAAFAADHGGTAVLRFDEVGKDQVPR